MRELHLNTGQWIRRIRAEQRIIITARGTPVATLIPFEPIHAAIRFADRSLVPGFAELPAIEHDSTKYISDARDRS